MMRIGKVVPVTEAEGPGRRTAIWLQGCHIGCPGCCNPEFLDPAGGTPMDAAALLAQIPAGEVEGITLLGGEPLEQAAELAEFLPLVRDQGLTIMLFSGHTWEELQANPVWAEVVEHCDLVVAGPFRRALTPDPRRWIGSTNQTIHCPRPHYRERVAAWEHNLFDIEVHLVGDVLEVHGAPELIELLTQPAAKPEKENP